MCPGETAHPSQRMSFSPANAGITKKAAPRASRRTSTRNRPGELGLVSAPPTVPENPVGGVNEPPGFSTSTRTVPGSSSFCHVPRSPASGAEERHEATTAPSTGTTSHRRAEEPMTSELHPARYTGEEVHSEAARRGRRGTIPLERPLAQLDAQR